MSVFNKATIVIKQAINFTDFAKIDIRSGTIIDAQINPKAKKPAYILKINFGNEIGIKTSSAQLTQNYQISDLINRKIVAVVNFAPKLIAGIKSEVLVLATVCESQGTLLLTPEQLSLNGSEIG